MEYDATLDTHCESYTVRWLPEEEVILFVPIGSHDIDITVKVIDSFDRIMNGLSTDRIPVNLLIDGERGGSISSKSRQHIAKFMKSSRVAKVSAFNVPALQRTILTFLAMASGKRNKVRIWKTREEAVTWLRS